MIRALFLVVAALPAAALPAAAELSKDKLVTHVRESFGIPPQVPIRAGDAKPSPVKGLEVVTLQIGEGHHLETREVHVSKDGAFYFLADAKDLRKDPDADRRAQLDLKSSPSKGPAEAPITIVEFSDFQCPFCQQAHQALESALKPYEGKVRLVFKNFPLEHIHPWAFQAAVAASCGERQKAGAFWTFADAFFGEQKTLTKETLKTRSLELAKKAELDAKKFETCYDKQETADSVRKDLENGEKLGVGSTPTFYVNGHPVRGYGGFEPFKQLIEAMLAGKHP